MLLNPSYTPRNSTVELLDDPIEEVLLAHNKGFEGRIELRGEREEGVDLGQVLAVLPSTDLVLPHRLAHAGADALRQSGLG